MSVLASPHNIVQFWLRQAVCLRLLDLRASWTNFCWLIRIRFCSPSAEICFQFTDRLLLRLGQVVEVLFIIDLGECFLWRHWRCRPQALFDFPRIGDDSSVGE